MYVVIPFLKLFALNMLDLYSGFTELEKLTASIPCYLIINWIGVNIFVVLWLCWFWERSAVSCLHACWWQSFVFHDWVTCTPVCFPADPCIQGAGVSGEKGPAPQGRGASQLTLWLSQEPAEALGLVCYPFPHPTPALCACVRAHTHHLAQRSAWFSLLLIIFFRSPLGISTWGLWSSWGEECCLSPPTPQAD